MHSPAIEAARAAVDRYRLPLLLAAIYDGLLGLIFLFLADPIFRALGIDLGANLIYAQLAAGLIAIMGYGFYLAWRDPLLNGDIVLLGAVFKAFYILLALYALARGELPHGLFLIFAAIDVIFLIVFVLHLRDAVVVRTAMASLVGERAAR